MKRKPKPSARKSAKRLTSTQRLIRQVAKLERRQDSVERSLLTLSLAARRMRRDVQEQSDVLGRSGSDIERRVSDSYLTVCNVLSTQAATLKTQSGHLDRMVEVQRKLLRGIVHLHERSCPIPMLTQAAAFMAKPLPVSGPPWSFVPTRGGGA